MQARILGLVLQGYERTQIGEFIGCSRSTLDKAFRDLNLDKLLRLQVDFSPVLELDDGNNTLYTGGWTNKDVNIISDHNEYINMSLDQSTWKPNQVTVTKEGETNQSFWMKKNSVDDILYPIP